MKVTDEILENVEESKDYIDLVDKLVKPHIESLDTLMLEIDKEITKPDYEMNINTIQSYYGKLSSRLYFMVDKLKYFEIYSSNAKANEQEAFNNAYLDEITSSDKKPAVAELNIKSESKSKKQSLANIVYASALKTVKAKIDAGITMVDTLKNILRAKTNLEYSSSFTNKGAF